ncbi:MAG: aminopeptidase [Xanthomonadales bacterium]|nr:aminopeptidase [Xanthomonadales bacterium]
MISRSLSCLGISFFLTACSGPGYYQQAIAGQWHLMHARQDVQSLLDHPDTRPELVDQLQTAGQIMAFATVELGLEAGDSYTSYVELERDALVWNVVATGEFSLQTKNWCFLVAGCVPYRGFFKQSKAEKSAMNLRNKGMDVMVAPAAAYSTLGWFSDPLLSTMFSGSDTRLAAYLFHELAHQRLYLKNDGQFNEGYASFVEEIGLKAWLVSSQKQDELSSWQQGQIARRDFSMLVTDLRDTLDDLYQSNQPDITKRQLKADAFDAFSREYEELSQNTWHGKRYYGGWFEEPLNNARLALFNTYEGSQCAFQSLLDQAGGDLREFHRLAKHQSKAASEERQQWLNQPCSGPLYEGDF